MCTWFKLSINGMKGDDRAKPARGGVWALGTAGWIAPPRAARLLSAQGSLGQGDSRKVTAKTKHLVVPPLHELSEISSNTGILLYRLPLHWPRSETWQGGTEGEGGGTDAS